MLDLKEEEKKFMNGATFVAGIDEVGRGPLAGPVLAACVVVEKGQKISKELLREVKDSKKISEKKREKIYNVILENFKYIGIASCDSRIIDKINILEASLYAMNKALFSLNIRPSFVFVDGNQKVKNIKIDQETIIKGDAKVFSIAAASIVAKVTRDKMMKRYHKIYPNYSFDKHKGYGTKLHLERLKIYGPCPIHRMSFRPLSQL